MRGSCLCGAVEFETDGRIFDFAFDHCSRCRKATGSAFGAWLVVEIAGFRWIRGESLKKDYEAPVIESPPGYRRAFCSKCGGGLPAVHEGVVIIPAGALDEDPEIRPGSHIFVEHKAPWFEITDALPRFPRKHPRAGS